MSDVCWGTEALLVDPVRAFHVPVASTMGVAESVSKQRCEAVDASTSHAIVTCSMRSSLKRPKAIGLQRFDFSVIQDNFSDCQMSHKPQLHHQHQQQQQQRQQQQQWECNQSTSDKTWERGTCRPAWPSMSVSMPCLPIPSTSGYPTNILPFLYLGSQHDALSEDVIKKHGITHVLNVSTTSPRSPFIPDENFLRIPVNDSHTDKLLPHFQEAFRFLDEAQKSRGCVLVHCLAGISRSPTLVIAYLMQSLALTADEAYSFVKEKRASISPNFNFLGQLVEFESLCRNPDDNQSRVRSDQSQQSNNVDVKQSRDRSDQSQQSNNGDVKQSRDHSDQSQQSNNADVKQSRDRSDQSQQRSTIDPTELFNQTPVFRRRDGLQRIVESDACSVDSSTSDILPEVTCAFDRKADDFAFPTEWETQFSQVSTESLDRLCFTPCFAFLPNEPGKKTAVNTVDTGGQISRNSSQTDVTEHSDTRPKSGRTRRHPVRPRGTPMSTVQCGFTSIKSSLKSSLKSSIFKRTEHHKPVFLLD